MDKYKIIRDIFASPVTENAGTTLLQKGKFFGGVYKGKKYMYSQKLIDGLSPERLETFIKKQIGMV